MRSPTNSNSGPTILQYANLDSNIGAMAQTRIIRITENKSKMPCNWCSRRWLHSLRTPSRTAIRATATENNSAYESRRERRGHGEIGRASQTAVRSADAV